MGQSGKGRRELRIAPVMTGGTSLSVWMGGVTCELYCLLAGGTAAQVAPQRPTEKEAPATVSAYEALLELTNLEPRVDVITGTSAGGLNGTLLAGAWRTWVPAGEFAELRTTWLDIADLKSLLRSPSESNPPSLLKGDQYFRTSIEKVLTDWQNLYETRRNSVGEGSPDHPLDLLITVTTVNPEPRNSRDDFGESISDVNHAHRLRFTDQHVAPNQSDWPKKLAIASRTSACIPGVFEPSYLPIGGGDAAKAKQPDFAQHASFTQSQYAVDGGVVVNLPLKEALERVFYQQADAPVRRVVLFIQPTPSTPEPKISLPDEPPTIRESLLTLVTAPRAEGVTAEVDRVRQHNAAVERQTVSRRSLNTLAIPDTVARANLLMPDYRKQRARASVRLTASYVTRAVSGMALDTSDLEDGLLDARLALIPNEVGEVGKGHVEWSWGIATIEHAASMVLQLLRSADPNLQAELAGQWANVSLQVEELRKIRELDRNYWSTQLDALAALLSDPAFTRDRDEAIVTWATTAYEKWPSGASTPPATRTDTFKRLESIYAQLIEQLDTIGQKIRKNPPPRSDLLAELDAIAPEGLDATKLAVHVRAVHVIQTMLLGDIVSREQSVELQVISWNAVDHLTGRKTDDKLAGTELARLGAFLKRSWRANDWFWGRMDGASRLVEMLLAPQHLHRTLRNSDANAAITKFLEASVFSQLTDTDRSTISGELLAIVAEADERRAPRPSKTIQLVAREIQLAIAREELPHVADAIRRSREIERANDLNGARFLRLYDAQTSPPTTPEAVMALVEAMEVGRESVGTEVGYGLLNRTISHGSAVVVNALSGDGAGVPPLTKLLRPLRTPLHTVNSVVSIATSASPLARFASALIFAVTGALVGLRIAGVDVSTPLVLAAEILLGAAAIVALVRSRFWWHVIPALLVAVVLGLTIVGDDIDDVLFSNAPPSITGEVSAGSTIDVGDDGLIRITRGDGETEVINDVEGATTVEIRSGGATWTQQPGCTPGSDGCAADGVAPWKRLLFTEHDVVRWLLVAATTLTALVCVRRLLKRRKLKPQPPAVGAIVGSLLATALAGWLVFCRQFDRAASWLLKGDPAAATGFKLGVSNAADQLGGYRVEIVVLVMIVVAVALGTAYDIAVRRFFRRARVLARVIWSKNPAESSATRSVDDAPVPGGQAGGNEGQTPQSTP